MDEARKNNIENVLPERLPDAERLRDSLAFWTTVECIRGNTHLIPVGTPSREWYGVGYDTSSWSARTTEILWHNGGTR